MFRSADSTNSNVSGNSATNDHSYHRSLSTRGTNSPGMTYGGGVYRHFLPQAAMALAEPSSPPIPSTDSYNGNGSPTGPSIADIDEHDDDKSAKASMNFTSPRVRTSTNVDDLEAVGSVLDQTSFPEEEDDDADDDHVDDASDELDNLDKYSPISKQLFGSHKNFHSQDSPDATAETTDTTLDITWEGSVGGAQSPMSVEGLKSSEEEDANNADVGNHSLTGLMRSTSHVIQEKAPLTTGGGSSTLLPRRTRGGSHVNGNGGAPGSFDSLLGRPSDGSTPSLPHANTTRSSN